MTIVVIYWKVSEKEVDVFCPKLFNNTTVSMPLMDPDDYFMRDGRIRWCDNNLTPTLEVSDNLSERNHETNNHAIA